MNKFYQLFLASKYSLCEVCYISVISYAAAEYSWWYMLLLIPIQFVHIILKIYFRPKGFL